MIRLALLLAMAAGTAAAETLPPNLMPPPAHVCVPSAVLARWARYGAERPWGEVSALMDEMRAVSQGLVPCDPKPAPPAAGPEAGK